MNLDGCWSYVLPEYGRGGNLRIKAGLVTGGNGTVTFDGVVTGTLESVHIVLLAKQMADCESVWGDAREKYVVSFRGERDGRTMRGRFERSEYPERSLDAVMTFEGPTP